jgi:hypothetical protein
MLVSVLLVAHIAVLGYWLGAELVINSSFRYVCWSARMPVEERRRLMEHVMDVDQHVRYALVLQLGLGFVLAALLGWMPGGDVTAWVCAALAAAWLVLVELTHRLRHAHIGQRLAAIDRGLRYGVMAALLLLSVTGSIATVSLPGWPAWSLPVWLTGKLVLFAGVMACGVGIRFALIDFFRIWQEVAVLGSTEAREVRVRRSYARATAILVGLWVLIAAIVVLSLGRPA